MPAAPCPGCRRHLVPHAGGSGDAGRKLTQCHDKDIRVQEKERGGVPAPLLSRHRRAEDEEEVAGRAARHQDEEEDTGRRQVALCAAE
jgi:hypothetical protein